MVIEVFAGSGRGCVRAAAVRVGRLMRRAVVLSRAASQRLVAAKVVDASRWVVA